MPSIPALPAAAPSFAERLSSDGRPHTAPSQAVKSSTHNNSNANDLASQDRALELAAAAFNSHPPFATAQIGPSPAAPRSFRSDDRYTERPLAPPLPLVLRPPLRKKKSFSRVSNWLFPASGERQHDDSTDLPHRRDMSVDSITNAPRPIRGDEGFYQSIAPPRGSVDSVSSLSTWQTTTTEEEEERQTVPTTTWSPGSSPVVQSTPKQTPVAERTAMFAGNGGLPAKSANAVQGPRPQSVGVAF